MQDVVLCILIKKWYIDICYFTFNLFLESGYVADVKYEGEAKPYVAEPAYHAAPVHHAAPLLHAAPIHHAAPLHAVHG